MVIISIPVLDLEYAIEPLSMDILGVEDNITHGTRCVQEFTGCFIGNTGINHMPSLSSHGASATSD